MIEMDEVGDVTIRARMDRRAREQPGHVFCRFGDRAYSFGEIDRAVNRLANGLLALGLQPGDRVGLMLPNHPDHIVAIFALAKIGLVRVPVNTHAKGVALDYHFKQFEPRALIVDAAYAAQIAPVLATCPVEHVIWRGKAGAPGFEQLMAHADARPPAVASGPDDILALTPSSGTTGPPKGVLKSDRTLRAGPMGTRRLTAMKPGDVFLLWEPLHHGAGVAVLIAAIIEPITLALVERFSASRFWDEARRYDVTHIHFLGGVIALLLKQPPRLDDRRHKVRVAWGGGCPPGLGPVFEQRFGVKIREGYGLSELITFVTINPDGPLDSIGQPLSYYDLKLIDDDGAEVPIGEAGEVIARARVPGLGFLGYFRNDEASRACMRGDWFCTGDLARRDAQGYLTFAGRKKESVRRRGVNISAWEVERIIGAHDAIEECALIGVPSEMGDDDLKLFVRLKPGWRLDPLDLVRWCEPRMAYFQIPRYVAFIDEFPKTPTQRIRKGELPRTIAECWDLETSGYVPDRKRSS